ncbi:MAG: membrane fusion protein MtrC [Verrucomicrobiota bacterium]
MKMNCAQPVLRKGFSVLYLALCVSSHLSGAEPVKVAPAKIENQVKEADLTTVVLTSAAEKRLGIETSTIEFKKIERTRLFGGEIVLSAIFPNSTSGTNSSGQSVFALLPSLAPTEMVRIAEAQIDADAQMERTRVQLDGAKSTLERAEKLLAAKVGSVRTVDEAKTQMGLAEASVKAAQRRRELLGAPMMESQNPKRVWVRVPVYVGDFSKLDLSSAARIGGLGDAPTPTIHFAKPVNAPPSANPNSATVDVVYELANDDRSFRLGQRVGATLTFKGLQENLVVPWSAVVQDIHGGSWIYENTRPQTFVRRRVQVQFVVGSDAVLAAGPKPGVKIVTTGVAELFGTEFGVGK